MPEPIDPALVARWQQLNTRPGSRRLAPESLRAAWWALRALRRARRDLAVNGLSAVVTAPPPVSWGARTGVNGVLNRTSPTCLERCVVQQKWLGAHGIDREVVVGVLRDGSGQVKAHAWIEGINYPDEYADFRVIHRLPAR